MDVLNAPCALFQIQKNAISQQLKMVFRRMKVFTKDAMCFQKMKIK